MKEIGMRYVVWMLLGAAVAVALGDWADLYRLGEPQLLIAAAIGGALGLIAYGGPVERSVTESRSRSEPPSDDPSFRRLGARGSRPRPA